MAVTLADKANETRTISVKWDDDTVDVAYRPNAVTSALLDSLDDAETGTEAFVALIVPVIDWWDVLDAKGKRIPVDGDSIAMMPMRFLNAIQAALLEDQRPPENGN